MQNIIQKLTSRKFLLALVGVVSGLAIAFGVQVEEITDAVYAVAGIFTALGSIVAYIKAEGAVDAAAVTGTADEAPLIMDGIDVDDLTDDQLRELLVQMGYGYTDAMTREEMLAELDTSSKTE